MEFGAIWDQAYADNFYGKLWNANILKNNEQICFVIFLCFSYQHLISIHNLLLTTFMKELCPVGIVMYRYSERGKRGHMIHAWGSAEQNTITCVRQGNGNRFVFLWNSDQRYKTQTEGNFGLAGLCFLPLPWSLSSSVAMKTKDKVTAELQQFTIYIRN